MQAKYIISPFPRIVWALFRWDDPDEECDVKLLNKLPGRDKTPWPPALQAAVSMLSDTLETLQVCVALLQGFEATAYARRQTLPADVGLCGLFTCCTPSAPSHPGWCYLCIFCLLRSTLYSHFNSLIAAHTAALCGLHLQVEGVAVDSTAFDPNAEPSAAALEEWSEGCCAYQCIHGRSYELFV